MFCQTEYKIIRNGEVGIPHEIYGKCKVLVTEEDGTMIITVWLAETELDEDEIKEMHIIAEEEAVIDKKEKKLRLPKVFLDYIGEDNMMAVCGVGDRIELMRARECKKAMNDTAIQNILEELLENLEEL